jgi:hypothetical protein
MSGTSDLAGAAVGAVVNTTVNVRGASVAVAVLVTAETVGSVSPGTGEPFTDVAVVAVVAGAAVVVAAVVFGTGAGVALGTGVGSGVGSGVGGNGQLTFREHDDVHFAGTMLHVKQVSETSQPNASDAVDGTSTGPLNNEPSSLRRFSDAIALKPPGSVPLSPVLSRNKYCKRVSATMLDGTVPRSPGDPPRCKKVRALSPAIALEIVPVSAALLTVSVVISPFWQTRSRPVHVPPSGGSVRHWLLQPSPLSTCCTTERCPDDSGTKSDCANTVAHMAKITTTNIVCRKIAVKNNFQKSSTMSSDLQLSSLLATPLVELNNVATSQRASLKRTFSVNDAAGAATPTSDKRRLTFSTLGGHDQPLEIASLKKKRNATVPVPADNDDDDGDDEDDNDNHDKDSAERPVQRAAEPVKQVRPQPVKANARPVVARSPARQPVKAEPAVVAKPVGAAAKKLAPAGAPRLATAARARPAPVVVAAPPANKPPVPRVSYTAQTLRQPSAHQQAAAATAPVDVPSKQARPAAVSSTPQRAAQKPAVPVAVHVAPVVVVEPPAQLESVQVQPAKAAESTPKRARREIDTPMKRLFDSAMATKQQQPPLSPPTDVVANRLSFDSE